MRTNLKLLNIFLCGLIFMSLVFFVPVYGAEASGEYLGTLGPGESISTRNIAYGIISVSPTNLPTFSGECAKCHSNNSLTNMYGTHVESVYSVKVDGYSVFDYSSPKEGTATIDFSLYSGKDATITMPSDYTISQTISCVGGRYGSDGSSKEPCDYSTKKTIKVTGVMQLYGYDKKPKVISNPKSVSSGTDESVSFIVAGEKAVGYRWQIGSEGVFTDLHDGTDSNSVKYSGTNTSILNITNTRCAINGTLYRCILIGENGDEVASDVASITVSDTSAPGVKLSYTPADKTYEGVTVLISATDPDSGLPEKPYYYNGDYRSEKSFKVSQNGTYRVKVTDNAGNSAEASISISNISPYPEESKDKPASQPSEPSPTPVPTNVPQPQIVIKEPAKKVTATPTPTPTPKPAAKEKDTKDPKETKTNTNKKININNLQNEGQNKNQNKDYDLDLDDDSVENTTEAVEDDLLLAEAPIEEMKVDEVENESIGSIIALSFGILLLLMMLILVMIFPVRIENADELGSWHFCSVKMLSLGKKYTLKLGLLLEDFDSLRLRFGPLFMLLCKDHELLILLDDQKTIVIDEITQNLVVDYSRARRK